jgi:Ca2+-binding RTX toxin-like protein
VRVDLGLGIASNGHAPGDSDGDASGDILESIEAAYGSVYADILIGSTGADTLNGNTGADNLHGGAGNDMLIGGFGDDRLDGGSGIDTVSYARAAAPVNVNLAAGKSTGGEDDILVSIENVIGSEGNDILNGDSRANGLEGGEGNDILRGGADRDVLAGGLGGDRFEYAAVSDSGVGVNSDRITNFIRAQGDRIDLSDIDANAQAIGNQAFIFIGSDHYSHHAGELRLAAVGGKTTIAGDIDGASNFQIVLTRIIDLQAADFFL